MTHLCTGATRIAVALAWLEEEEGVDRAGSSLSKGERRKAAGLGARAAEPRGLEQDMKRRKGRRPGKRIGPKAKSRFLFDF